MTRRRLGAVLLWAGVALVGLPTALVTAARLAGSDERFLVLVQAFTPFAVPAYALVLLLAVGLTWRARRRLPIAVAVLAALGLALHAWWEAPMLLGGQPAAAAGGVRLTVMTANIEYGGGDVTAIARAVREQHVGLLAVEEITPEALQRLRETGVTAELPYTAGRAEPGASGTMLFSRTPLTDVRQYPTFLGTWAATTGGWRVVAVHPAAPVTARWAGDQALLRATAVAEHPDLMLGDFNATLDHRPLRRIMDTGLRDAAELTNAGWQPTWPADGFDGLPFPAGAAIDHVLVGPGLTALRTRTVPVAGTDHRALVAELAARG